MDWMVMTIRSGMKWNKKGCSTSEEIWMMVVHDGRQCCQDAYVEPSQEERKEIGCPLHDDTIKVREMMHCQSIKGILPPSKPLESHK